MGGWDVYFAQLMIFAAVFLLVMGIKTLICGTPEEEDGSKDSLPPVFRLFWYETRYFAALTGHALATRSAAKAREYQGYIVRSNLRLEVADIYGSQTLWAVLLAVIAGIMSFMASPHPLYLVAAIIVGLFLGWCYPLVVVQKIAQQRQDKIARSLPFAVDLVTSAMQAGLDFNAAVRYYVSNSEKGPLVQEFGIALKEMELGKSRVDALRTMSDRVQLDEFRSLVSAVAQGAEMGAAIVDTLRINAEEMRRARFARAERQAQRAPSLMLIPMALFILPAVFIIIFMPVYLRVQGSGLSGMF